MPINMIMNTAMTTSTGVAPNGYQQMSAENYARQTKPAKLSRISLQASLNVWKSCVPELARHTYLQALSHTLCGDPGTGRDTDVPYLRSRRLGCLTGSGTWLTKYERLRPDAETVRMTKGGVKLSFPPLGVAKQV